MIADEGAVDPVSKTRPPSKCDGGHVSCLYSWCCCPYLYLYGLLFIILMVDQDKDNADKDNLDEHDNDGLQIYQKWIRGKNL